MFTTKHLPLVYHSFLCVHCSYACLHFTLYAVQKDTFRACVKEPALFMVEVSPQPQSLLLFVLSCFLKLWMCTCMCVKMGIEKIKGNLDKCLKQIKNGLTCIVPCGIPFILFGLDLFARVIHYRIARKFQMKIKFTL